MTVLLYALVGCVTLLIGVWIGARGREEPECNGEHHWGEATQSWGDARVGGMTSNIVELNVPSIATCQHDGCNETRERYEERYYVHRDQLYRYKRKCKADHI